MASLNNEVKAFIVHGLANFQTPTQIIESVKLEFGLEVSIPQVSFYNPNTKNAQKRLGQEWIDLFNTYREKAISDTSNLWIAHLPQRLSKYQDEYEKTKNPKLKLEILKQASQDVGGVYVNDSTIAENEMKSSAQPVQVVVEVKDARKNAEP